MNKRSVLLSVILVLSVVFAVYAQVSLQVGDGAGATNTITIKKASYQDEAFTGTINNNGTTTGAITWYGGSNEEQSLINIGETAIASASVPSGNLAIYWDTTNLGLVFKYKNATGTNYTSLVPGTDTDSPSGYAVLSGGNAFSGNQSVVSGEVRVGSTTDAGAFPLQVTGKSYMSDEVSVGGVTDLGDYKLQVTGSMIVSTGSVISGNPATQITQDATGFIKLTAIATPTLATGVVFFSSSDYSFYGSKDGAAWTKLDN